jgi:hypothetical protein
MIEMSTRLLITNCILGLAVVANAQPHTPTTPPHFRWSERLAHELDYKHTIGNAKELSTKERRELLAFVLTRFKHPVNEHDAAMFADIPEEQMGRLAADTRIELLDLNGDGTKEIIAQGNGSGPCGGTGNCIVMVLQNTPAGWKCLLDSRAGRSGGGFEMIRVLETATNGFRDIVLAAHDSASDRTLYLYRYHDGRYRKTDCYNATWLSTEGGSWHELRQPEVTPCPK